MIVNCMQCFSDSTPLLNKASSAHMFDTMAMEIEQLLARVRAKTTVKKLFSQYTYYTFCIVPNKVHTGWHFPGNK